MRWMRPVTMVAERWCGLVTMLAMISVSWGEGVEAHDFEEGAVDDASLNFARLTQANHGETDGRELAERAQRFNAGAQILDFGHGECCVVVASAQGALADVDQPVLVAVDERLEEHAAHQREDGGDRKS